VLEIRELIRRLQLGESDRQIARDLQVSRKTVSKYRGWAQQDDVLTAPLPDPATLGERPLDRLRTVLGILKLAHKFGTGLISQA
jgi:hypothetical protein